MIKSNGLEVNKKIYLSVVFTVEKNYLHEIKIGWTSIHAWKIISFTWKYFLFWMRSFFSNEKSLPFWVGVFIQLTGSLLRVKTPPYHEYLCNFHFISKTISLHFHFQIPREHKFTIWPNNWNWKCKTMASILGIFCF